MYRGIPKWVEYKKKNYDFFFCSTLHIVKHLISPPLPPPLSFTPNPPFPASLLELVQITPDPLFSLIRGRVRKPGEDLRAFPGAVNAQEPYGFTGQGGVANFPGWKDALWLVSFRAVGGASAFFFFPSLSNSINTGRVRRNMYNTHERVQTSVYMHIYLQ